MNAERLLLLADFLETKVPPARWDFSSVFGREWDGGDLSSCGSTACAIGWATQIPELRAVGMVIPDESIGKGWRWAIAIGLFAAAATVFELDADDIGFLFDTGVEFEHGRGRLPATASAQDVATRIREFVARGGRAIALAEAGEKEMTS